MFLRLKACILLLISLSLFPALIFKVFFKDLLGGLSPFTLLVFKSLNLFLVGFELLTLFAFFSLFSLLVLFAFLIFLVLFVILVFFVFLVFIELTSKKGLNLLSISLLSNKIFDNSVFRGDIPFN